MDHITALARMQRWALTGALALVPVIGVAQAQLHYNAKAAIEQERMERLYVETIQCLQESTVAVLRMGLRDPQEVRNFNLKFCGHALFAQLTKRMGWSESDGVALIVRLSDMTIINNTTK